MCSVLTPVDPLCEPVCDVGVGLAGEQSGGGWVYRAGQVENPPLRHAHQPLPSPQQRLEPGNLEAGQLPNCTSKNVQGNH